MIIALGVDLSDYNSGNISRDSRYEKHKSMKNRKTIQQKLLLGICIPQNKQSACSYLYVNEHSLMI